MEYLVRIISQGLFGPVPKHVILVSNTVRYPSPYGGLPHSPMVLSPDFMAYGMCMVHAHIRTPHNKGSKIGRHIVMMLQLEAMLQQRGVVQTKKTDAYGKTKTFKSLLKSRGHDGGEARWVFAALDLLRHMRNILDHTPPLPSAMRGYEKTAGDLNALATECGRVFGVSPEFDIQDSYSSHKKWMTSLADHDALD